MHVRVLRNLLGAARCRWRADEKILARSFVLFLSFSPPRPSERLLSVPSRNARFPLRVISDLTNLGGCDQAGDWAMSVITSLTGSGAMGQDPNA